MRNVVFEEDRSWSWDAAESNNPKSNEIYHVVYCYVEQGERGGEKDEPGTPKSHGGDDGGVHGSTGTSPSLPSTPIAESAAAEISANSARNTATAGKTTQTLPRQEVSSEEAVAGDQSVSDDDAPDTPGTEGPVAPPVRTRTPTPMKLRPVLDLYPEESLRTINPVRVIGRGRG